MSFDVESERFDITYDPRATSPGEIATVIRDLGYEPKTVVAATSGQAGLTTVSLASLPAEFRDLFEQARQAEKPVLLDFTAPG